MATIAALLGESPIAREEASLILQHYLQRTSAWLIAHSQDELSGEQAEVLWRLFARRAQGEPVAYILGERDFWGLTLSVSPDVLIPRPDTETLVEWSVALIDAEACARVLDLGTGSGAIALALKSTRGALSVTATDVSEAALAVARSNSARLGLSVEFIHSNWFEALASERWPLIVSNPPYIAEADDHLGRGDLPHEPPSALVSGERGLDAITTLVEQSPAALLHNGWLLLEHGYDQGLEVRRLLELRGFSDIQTRRDLAGQERVTGGCWRAE